MVKYYVSCFKVRRGESNNNDLIMYLKLSVISQEPQRYEREDVASLLL